MDRMDKFLRRLSAEELIVVEEVVGRILTRKLGALDHKKLKDTADVYRVRVRDVRIIFQMNDRNIRIITIGRRNEQTYRDIH